MPLDIDFVSNFLGSDHSPWLSAPFLLCLSRQISLRETSLHQLHQGIYRFLLISAIGDDLNGRAAHDAQGKNTQQALGVYPALFLLHPNGSLVLIGLLDKKSRGPRVQTNMILNGYLDRKSTRLNSSH